VTLYFYRYGENGTLFRCGGGLNAGNFSMLYRRDALAGIAVTFYTTGQASNNEVNRNTAWDLQNPIIRILSTLEARQNYLNSFPCG
jgi:hypothetical protein